LPHNPKFKEYALNDLNLTLKLLNYFKKDKNYDLWFNRISPLLFKQWEVSFNGIEVDVKELNKRIKDLNLWRERVLNLLPDLTKGIKSDSKSRGWNVNSIVTPWLLKEFKVEDLDGLPRTPKGNISFNSKTKKALLLKYPQHHIISKLPDLSKKNKTLDQLKEIRKNLDGNILRYAYKMFGAATGRFSSSKPAIHNFAKRAPREEILIFKSERDEDFSQRYQLRRFLIKREGVFFLDFKNQEDRMTAYLVGNNKEADLFIKGEDFHSHLASRLGCNRDVSKSIRHGTRYTRGAKSIAQELSFEGLKVSEEEMKEFIPNFWREQPELKAFVQKIEHIKAWYTPLLKRRIGLKEKDKLNYIIQGSCVDLLLVALEYLFKQKRLKVLPHFHDELEVKCLACESHKGICGPIMSLEVELEALFPFTWPNTNIRVFELGISP